MKGVCAAQNLRLSLFFAVACAISFSDSHLPKRHPEDLLVVVSCTIDTLLEHVTCIIRGLMQGVNYEFYHSLDDASTFFSEDHRDIFLAPNETLHTERIILPEDLTSFGKLHLSVALYGNFPYLNKQNALLAHYKQWLTPPSRGIANNEIASEREAVSEEKRAGDSGRSWERGQLERQPNIDTNTRLREWRSRRQIGGPPPTPPPAPPHSKQKLAKDGSASAANASAYSRPRVRGGVPPSDYFLYFLHLEAGKQLEAVSPDLLCFLLSRVHTAGSSNAGVISCHQHPRYCERWLLCPPGSSLEIFTQTQEHVLSESHSRSRRQRRELQREHVVAGGGRQGEEGPPPPPHAPADAQDASHQILAEATESEAYGDEDVSEGNSDSDVFTHYLSRGEWSRGRVLKSNLKLLPHLAVEGEMTVELDGVPPQILQMQLPGNLIRRVEDQKTHTHHTHLHAVVPFWEWSQLDQQIFFEHELAGAEMVLNPLRLARHILPPGAHIGGRELFYVTVVENPIEALLTRFCGAQDAHSLDSQWSIQQVAEGHVCPFPIAGVACWDSEYLIQSFVDEGLCPGPVGGLEGVCSSWAEEEAIRRVESFQLVLMPDWLHLSGPLLCAYLGACDAADWPQADTHKADTHKRDREAEGGRGGCRGGGRGGGRGGAAALEDAVYDRLVARNKRDIRFYAAARARARQLLQEAGVQVEKDEGPPDTWGGTRAPPAKFAHTPSGNSKNGQATQASNIRDLRAGRRKVCEKEEKAGSALEREPGDALEREPGAADGILTRQQKQRLESRGQQPREPLEPPEPNKRMPQGGKQAGGGKRMKIDGGRRGMTIDGGECSECEWELEVHLPMWKLCQMPPLSRPYRGGSLTHGLVKGEVHATASFLTSNAQTHVFKNPYEVVSLSQDGEEMYAYTTFFWGLTRGTFLELGALDGELYSNTFGVFERLLAWKGLLIEASAKSYSMLPLKRPNQIAVRAVICQEAQDVHWAEEGGLSSAVSGIVEHMSAKFKDEFHSFLPHTQDLPVVPCLALQTILDALDMHHFNFFVLDVEGAELAILSSLDWSRTSFDVLCVETLGSAESKSNITQLLSEQGYLRWEHPTGDRNSWYIRRGFQRSSRPASSASTHTNTE